MGTYPGHYGNFIIIIIQCTCTQFCIIKTFFCESDVGDHNRPDAIPIMGSIIAALLFVVISLAAVVFVLIRKTLWSKFQILRGKNQYYYCSYLDHIKL